ncbi:putative quinol monooxygenase [Caballeronia ptereochthonis]|uniref:Antibiotic biosynthesis monooxygenase n=1 Tax=Caballeronia ptereochthonis TaxID=1777144 RepID=A0A158AHZ0_9BURK|nr:putative quinol monooxygenase [Caballeronia ptereochthonis]SAK57428.1 antibiotic biosynthesis monooxygenase [Caballeronia ptereochthonis]
MKSQSGVSTPFVVIAEFEVKPECLSDFLALARDDAQHSLADESGCRQFDIVRVEDTTPRVVFYEVYDDRAAFDAHLQTPHLSRFRGGFPALIVAERPVRFGAREHS